MPIQLPFLKPIIVVFVSVQVHSPIARFHLVPPFTILQSCLNNFHFLRFQNTFLTYYEFNEIPWIVLPFKLANRVSWYK